jgi:tRNA A-37 threonylcarbamoyl transferase component Bud32
MAGPAARAARVLSPGATSPAATCAWLARGADGEALAEAVRTLLSGGAGVEVVREKPGRRRLARATLASGERCFLKQIAADRRDAWRRPLGLTPAQRELRMLRRLAQAGVRVPEALAHFTGADGAQVLVTRFLDGEPLADALRRPPRERRALIARVGELVASLHAAGVAHRDLHRENVWVTRAGPVLLDLQQAVALSARALRLRDLGELDASLAPLLSKADRIRLRAAATGLARPYGARARRELRAVGRAARARRRAHVESRTRRCLREGRLYARVSGASGRGMRLRTCAEQAVDAALGGPPRSGAEGRVLRYETAWPWGSPARDAWVAGHGLRARGIGAPLPLAFAERRRGLGVVSQVWLEAFRDAHPEDPVRWLAEVVDAGTALRREGVALGSDAPWCRDARSALGPADLARVRFRRRLRAAEIRRIDDRVAELIAAAPTSEAEREAARRRYAARRRFES